MHQTHSVLPPAGRFAPTPSGDLHLGNLRTALLAYAAAWNTDRAFRLRIEDLDTARCSRDVAERQIEDLASLGIEWEGEILWQSQRHDAYQQAVEQLQEHGLVYECYCSRKDIIEAPRAPHAPPGSYPGTCRDLTPQQRQERRTALAAQGHRQPALRLRAQVDSYTISEHWDADIPGLPRDQRPVGVHRGTYTGLVDDVVLRRGDGVWAYNLAVVVDDAAQGVDQVVRGSDLLSSAPRQAYLAHLLGLPECEYHHVPLMRDVRGERMAKRHTGQHTLRQEYAQGRTPREVRDWLLSTVGDDLPGVH